jgi:hypothetical protein
MKAVDADSDEQAARFDPMKADLNEYRDYVLFVGWEWAEITEDGLTWEAPQIFTWAFIPAFEIAKVRDERLYATGGKIENGKVLVPSTKKPGTFTEDPGNFGKLWRIMQKSQRTDAQKQSRYMQDFLRFLSEVDKHSSHKRL